MKHFLNSVFIMFLFSMPLLLTLACPILPKPFYMFYTWVIKLIPRVALLTLLSCSKTLIALFTQYKISSSCHTRSYAI